jgi:hypothetical protein
MCAYVVPGHKNSFELCHRFCRRTAEPLFKAAAVGDGFTLALTLNGQVVGFGK